MTDFPENIDLRWLGRILIDLRDGHRRDTRDLKKAMRAVRDDLDVVAMRVIRMDSLLTELRDDMRDLYARYRDLRERVIGHED